MARSPTGITPRHSRSCRSHDEGNCNCEPTYTAWVWSRRDSKKLYRTFPTQAAAKQWRVDASSSVRRGTVRATPAVTLRDAWTAWVAAADRGQLLSRYRRPYKSSALRGYKADMERYVLPDLGACRLGDVTADDFQALVERLVGQGLSGSKVRNVLVPAQALYRRHRRQVFTDPTDGLDLPEPGGRRERVVAPTGAAKLLAALPHADRALWATAAYAGLRRGELRALRVSDVREAHVDVSRGWDDYDGAIEPKSRAGKRQVPLPNILAEILSEHVERSGRSGEDLLFGRSADAPFTPSHVRKSANEAWTTAELERIGLHELRHSYSTYLDAAGVSETRADRYMGHANSSVANRYRHQLEGQLAEDAVRLDAYLEGAMAGKVVALPTGTRTGTQDAQTRMVAQGA
jgi:integrase